MLDTHVAPEGDLIEDTQDGFDYRYYNFKESGRTDPFAGLDDHAKWIALDDLLKLLSHLGFANIDVAEHRDERNGPRVPIYAHR